MMNIFPLQNGSFKFLNPLEAVYKATFRRVDWVSVGGIPLQGAVFPAPGIQQILDGSVTPELGNLPFRNPDNFVAGQLHQHIHAWKSMLGNSPTHQLISDWITNKVDVERFVVPFRGKFKAVFYDCPFPPSKVNPIIPLARNILLSLAKPFFKGLRSELFLFGVKWDKWSLRALCFPLELNHRSPVCAKMPDF